MKTKTLRIIIILATSLIFSLLGFSIISSKGNMINAEWNLIVHIICILCSILLVSIMPDFSLKTFYKPYILLLVLLGPTSLLVSNALMEYQTWILIISLSTWVIMSIIFEITRNVGSDIINKSIFIIWLLTNSILAIGRIPFFNFTNELVYKYQMLNNFYDLRLMLTIIFGFSLLITSIIRAIKTKYTKLDLKYQIKELPDDNAFVYFSNLFFNFNSYLRNYIKQSISFLKFYIQTIGIELNNSIKNLLNDWLKVFSFVLVFLLTIALSKLLAYFSTIIVDYLQVEELANWKLYFDLFLLILGFIIVYLFVFSIKFFLNIIYFRSDIRVTINELVKLELSIFWSFFVFVFSFFISGFLLCVIPQMFSDVLIFEKFNLPIFTILTIFIVITVVVIYNINLAKGENRDKLKLWLLFSNIYHNVFGTRANIYRTIVVVLFFGLLFYIIYDTSFNKRMNFKNKHRNNPVVENGTMLEDSINCENTTGGRNLSADSIIFE